ncbi:GldG family protein [Marichromatium bheemlicum]|uniref:ABC transporter n=1 Tax=Marichromatium bheemlicum TaxID=365339 RepID=A0ABX1ICP0_9GAMM|nr:GldG family protein [Marichromatium bheemlicum]NKN34120.1 ABC transporter [Marichromatium bheemlicum]
MSSLPRLHALLKRFDRPLADGVFLVLLVALAIATGWLSARHDHYWDWTSGNSNSLSVESRQLLAQLDQPLRITIFAAPEGALGRSIERFLARYVQAHPGLELEFVDPRRFPERARDAQVRVDGQLLIEYHDRRETLARLDEHSLSAAIARLLEDRRPWVAVIEGHGERNIDGDAPGELGRLGHELEAQGFLARPLDLALVSDVPINTHLVVLSQPEIALFPGEVERLIDYLDRGGNLLWLLDPGPLNGLEPLAEQLGLKPLPGVLFDPESLEQGAITPTLAQVHASPTDHPLTTALTQPALFHGARAFAAEHHADWALATPLVSGPRSWNEVGRIEAESYRDEVVGEQAGPLPLLLALTRSDTTGEHEQRVAVIGDGDFMSNAWINRAGNRALAFALIDWLSGARMHPLPPQAPAPAALELDDGRRLLLGAGSLGVIPGLLLGAWLLIQWRRGRRAA